MNDEHIVEIPSMGSTDSCNPFVFPNQQENQNASNLNIDSQPGDGDELSEAATNRRAPSGQNYRKLTISGSTPFVKWYFEEHPIKSSTEIKFQCTEEYRPPVKAQASCRFTQWIGDAESLAGPYNVILGISFENLNLESIESINFSFGPGNMYYYGPIEIITRHELEDLAKSSTGVLRLKLHRQHMEMRDSRKRAVVDMEIRASGQASVKLDPGVIELHYMELHAFQMEPHDESLLIVHRPHVWSIDVGFEDKLSDLKAPMRSTRIFHYDISGDGTHIATLTELGKCVQLDLWAIESNATAAVAIVDALPANGSATHSDPLQSHPRPSFCCRVQLPLLDPIFLGLIRVPITVSVSWDATKVALMAGSTNHLMNTFQVYSYRKNAIDSLKKSPPSEISSTLTPVNEDQLCPKIKGFVGSGKFHITATKNQRVEDEIYVTCDRTSVELYSTHEKWSHIRSIKFSDNVPCYPRQLVEAMRARYFAWTDHNDMVLTCDLETGLLVSCMNLITTDVRFSSDGSMMVLRQAGGIVTTRWTESTTIVGTLESVRGYPTFIKNDSQIFVPLVDPDETFGPVRLGAILDVENLLTINKLSVPVQDLEEQLFSIGSGGQYLYSSYGSKLDLVRIDDFILQQYPRPKYCCDDRCFENLSRMRSMDAISALEDDDKFTLPSGLTFKLAFPIVKHKRRRNGAKVQCLVVSLSDATSQRGEALRITPAEIGDITGDWLLYKVAFDASTMHMIVYTSLFVMVWNIPSTVDGEFSLQLAWWTQIVPFQEIDRTDWGWTELTQCTHGQAHIKVCTIDEYYEDTVLDILRLRDQDIFSYVESPRFLDGLLVLIEMFDTGDENFRHTILQYVGRYINVFPNPSNHLESVISRICQSVTQENHSLYGRFLNALLSSSYGRWVPRPDLNSSTNPISMLLELTKKVPRAIALAEIMIDYCVRMAKKEKDFHFITPVMGPLHELINQQQLHPEVSHSTLRKLALIPAKERSFIVDHHVIAHSPEFRLRFWEKNARPLYECVDPVMQLDRSPKVEPHNPQNENFSRDLFVASFDMLWRAPEKKLDTRSSVARIKSPTRSPQSWIRTLFHIILLNCKLKTDIGVNCHDFALESLDNPAIAALVEYKWNTIGFSYWIFRFFWQCVYYLLVLFAVFMQVYSDQQKSLFGVFIAIIALSAIFLWLELLQAIHSPRRYFASPYNIVDIVVFALPLVGSVCQVINIINDDQTGNTNTLSFSVLLIFLHFLFELRIIKSVCHFVTIIIRILGEIRVFFVVFAGGILAFTIAILHLLRACAVGTCDNSTIQFPSHFYGAISSTYFFMGGIWDPVDDLFAGDNWAFHTMMIIYFFFTTILLLNVLIALINVAFSAGDEAWLLVWIDNRLQYVENAENLTHHIPGFREAHDWFPKEIYYSATLQEVKDYQTKYFKKNGEDSGRGEVVNQRMFGQTLPAKKVAAAASVPLARRGSDASVETLSDQQQIIQDMRKVLVEVLGKTDKRVEVLEAQLTEMRQMLSKFCKEP